MKVLMTVPTFPTVPHVWPATQASIDAMLAATKLAVEIVYQGDDNPKLSHYENLRNKHNAARARVLAEGFDALFSVEADMIVPPDALDKLAQVDADIAYGLYCGRTSYIWLLMTEVGAARGRSIVADEAVARGAWGKVIESKGAGMGCTLIHRRALEQLTFRIERAQKLFADDWYLALDAQAAGLRQAHDTSVVCGHILRNGAVVWPDLIKTARGRFKAHRIERIGE